MLRWTLPITLVVLSALQPAATSSDLPAYTADRQLIYPANYREWIFLGSGLDMSYTSDAADPSMHMFNSVFANPSAYRVFQQTGRWPEGTMLMLENRGAQGAASINKRGKTETTELMGLEIHVLDTAHTPGGWGFYNFDNPKPAKLIDRTATCYTCHEQHGAVDTTFVQFYPTLLETARQRHTLSPAYLKELRPAPVVKTDSAR